MAETGRPHRSDDTPSPVELPSTGRSGAPSGGGPSASPTLAQLRALVAVADTLHFGEAASRLGVSQPSVSASVSSLEACLGAHLVERSTRRVVMTPSGRAVASQAREILAGIERLAAAAKGEHPFNQLLRLGMIPTVAPYILAPVLRALNHRLPDLRPEVTEGLTAQLLDELLARRLDAVVVALPSGSSVVTEIPLYREDFVLLVPPEHPLAGAVGIDPKVLREERLLLLAEGHCLASQALEICRQVGAATDHPARAASLTTIAQLVAAGLGSTLLPETALPVETRKGKLAVARFRPPAPGRTIGLAFRPGSALASEQTKLAEHFRHGLLRPGFGGQVMAVS
jgi:LysR family hydrogen peroxide-inducible transcriptional activator